MDAYGSGPLSVDTPEVRENFDFHPACFTALRRLADDLAARRIEYVVILLPPMPAWLAAYDPDGARDRAYRRQVAETLGPQALLIDGARGPHFADSDFADHAHLQWASVPRFMDYVGQHMSRRVAASQQIGDQQIGDQQIGDQQTGDRE
jgi:hypothetical protein